MQRHPRGDFDAPPGLLTIEDCVDAQGHIAMPPGTTLISLLERNVASVGDTVAYRFLDFARAEGRSTEITWTQLDTRLRAIASRIQQRAGRGERVAILAPQGLEYVAGFYSALKAGTIAVPLFAPELPGHAERLQTALADARPGLVLTTAAARGAVTAFLSGLPGNAPQVLVIDDIDDSAAETFAAVTIDENDVSHLQYTSGATRPPVGVEITHRAFSTNLVQMILSIDLLNRNTHGVSWLPLYHDMGLSMIGFPAVYGGHSTLMSPTAFVRRPLRWIQALSAGSAVGRVVTAAPNFAYEWAAQRGLPQPGEHIDLSNVVMIIGSEPVSIGAITEITEAFAPHGLPPSAIKPSYGIAEATLMVATTAPDTPPSVAYFDCAELAAGRAVRVAAGTPDAVAHVACGQIARSLWAVIVNPDTGAELPDNSVGEIWLHGANVGHGYWDRPTETEFIFGARLASRLPTASRADPVAADADWLRTTDLGMFVDGDLYVVGRIADLITIDGRTLQPQDIEATAADASALVRRGYVAAFTAADEQVVIIAERAAGTSRSDPAPAIEAIRSAVSRRHGVPVADVRLLPAGAIPRTTSGKLARRACRVEYLDGTLGRHSR
jgi:fatty-acyl-CoA synthase